MQLHRIVLDPRCREARRDLADPYELHSTLCRAFSPPEVQCPPGAVLWRLEALVAGNAHHRSAVPILVQSDITPIWDRIGIAGWLAEVDPPLDLGARLGLNALVGGENFRFRLRANPAVCRKGKRYGLLKRDEQLAWIARKGTEHGFALVRYRTEETQAQVPLVQISDACMLTGRSRAASHVSIYSVLFDGAISVVDPERFVAAVHRGIGHGKALGLGLLSIARMSRGIPQASSAS